MSNSEGGREETEMRQKINYVVSECLHGYISKSEALIRIGKIVGAIPPIDPQGEIRRLTPEEIQKIWGDNK